MSRSILYPVSESKKDDVRSVVCSDVPVPWLPAMMDMQLAKTV